MGQREKGFRNMEDASSSSSYDDQWDIAALQDVNRFAVAGIRSLVMVNGGAVVVLMALIGSAWSNDGTRAMDIAGQLTPAISWFITGLIAGMSEMGKSFPIGW